MIAKLPVIAYDVGGIGEVIISGKTGILVEKNDEKTFVKQITRTDNEMIQQQLNNGYTLIFENYDNQKIAKRFTSFYNKILVA